MDWPCVSERSKWPPWSHFGKIVGPKQPPLVPFWPPLIKMAPCRPKRPPWKLGPFWILGPKRLFSFYCAEDSAKRLSSGFGVGRLSGSVLFCRFVFGSEPELSAKGSRLRRDIFVIFHGSCEPDSLRILEPTDQSITKAFSTLSQNMARQSKKELQA